MSVSHPNCLTTFKLSVMRLLRGEGLLESELQSSEEEGEDGAAAAAGGANGRRQLRSLLSGAEAEDVSDPNGLLPQGLYETWIVMDVRGWCWDVGGWHSAELRAAGFSKAARKQAGLHTCTQRTCLALLDRLTPALSALPQYCDRGSLGDALAGKRLALPDGRPNLVRRGRALAKCVDWFAVFSQM